VFPSRKRDRHGTRGICIVLEINEGKKRKKKKKEKRQRERKLARFSEFPTSARSVDVACSRYAESYARSLNYC